MEHAAISLATDSMFDNLCLSLPSIPHQKSGIFDITPTMTVLSDAPGSDHLLSGRSPIAYPSPRWRLRRPRASNYMKFVAPAGSVPRWAAACAVTHAATARHPCRARLPQGSSCCPSLYAWSLTCRTPDNHHHPLPPLFRAGSSAIHFFLAESADRFARGFLFRTFRQTERATPFLLSLREIHKGTSWLLYLSATIFAYHVDYSFICSSLH